MSVALMIFIYALQFQIMRFKLLLGMVRTYHKRFGKIERDLMYQQVLMVLESMSQKLNITAFYVTSFHYVREQAL